LACRDRKELQMDLLDRLRQNAAADSTSDPQAA
jgi:hypothetical protein